MFSAAPIYNATLIYCIMTNKLILLFIFIFSVLYWKPLPHLFTSQSVRAVAGLQYSRILLEWDLNVTKNNVGDSSLQHNESLTGCQDCDGTSAQISSVTGTQLFDSLSLEAAILLRN